MYANIQLMRTNNVIYFIISVKQIHEMSKFIFLFWNTLYILQKRHIDRLSLEV